MAFSKNTVRDEELDISGGVGIFPTPYRLFKSINSLPSSVSKSSPLTSHDLLLIKYLTAFDKENRQ